MSAALRLIDFLNNSPSPFHAINEATRILSNVGYVRLSEGNEWNSSIVPGGRYYFTRNGSSLVAFSVGKSLQSKNNNKLAFNIVAAHSDSPCLKVKPISNKKAKDGFVQVAVETYGGGLWHTWFDRDLGIAGRVISSRKRDGCDDEMKEELVRVDRPILRIPTLAIHLDRAVNGEGFKFNTELQLTPILSTESKEQVEQMEQVKSHTLKAPASLLNVLNCNSSCDVISADLCLFDIQGANIGGVYNEFIHSARLDNLFMSFTSLIALSELAEAEAEDENIKMLVLFDNEEVGSLSANGAESTLISSTISRVLSSLNATEQYPEIMSRSFLISADMAHAVHPNYSDKHDELHRPQLQKGIVLKYNSNQRYTTNSRSAAFIKSLAQRHSIPLQEFMVRNDSPCGSTIGPIVAAQLGLEAVDIGAPQLSMHSIRETAGIEDISHSIALFKAFWQSNRREMIKTLDQ